VLEQLSGPLVLGGGSAGLLTGQRVHPRRVPMCPVDVAAYGLREGVGLADLHGLLEPLLAQRLVQPALAAEVVGDQLMADAGRVRDPCDASPVETVGPELRACGGQDGPPGAHRVPLAVGVLGGSTALPPASRFLRLP